MTVQNSEFDDFGQKPQTLYYEQNTSVSGTSDVINFDFNLKPGYYTYSSITGGSSRTIFFNAQHTGAQLGGSGSLFRATSSLSTGYLPLNNMWGAVVGTFTPSSPVAVLHSYFQQGVWILATRNGGYQVSTNNGNTFANYTSTFGQPDGHAFVYLDGVYINASSSGGRISTSTNPAGGSGTWTTRTTYGLSTINFWSAVNPRLAGTTEYSHFATSNDGYTWTTRARPSSTNRGLKQAGAYNYMYADPGNLYYSSNNTTWTQVSIPSSPSGSLNGITFGNGVYIATGQYWATGSLNHNGIYYSTNGTTFTTAGISGGESGFNLQNSNRVNLLEYSTTGGRFVIFSTSAVFSSADGLTWVKHSTSGGNIGNSDNYGVFSSQSGFASHIDSNGKVVYSNSSGTIVRSYSNSGVPVWNSSSTLERGSITYWGDVDTSKFSGKAMF
jgi:hypothetical protein